MIDNMLGMLLLAQIAMGAFDTLYHHELTQRLAWRPGQATELRLHGVRNLVYAIVFLALGLSVPQGGWAILLMALLTGEAFVTLWDFVEEDRTRLLPATERVTHTLLTLNYGLILALLLPGLWVAASAPSELPFHWNGIFSVLFALAAIGVMVSGLRDLVAAGRLSLIHIYIVDHPPRRATDAHRVRFLHCGRRDQRIPERAGDGGRLYVGCVLPRHLRADLRGWL